MSAIDRRIRLDHPFVIESIIKDKKNNNNTIKVGGNRELC